MFTVESERERVYEGLWGPVIFPKFSLSYTWKSAIFLVYRVRVNLKSELLVMVFKISFPCV